MLSRRHKEFARRSPVLATSKDRQIELGPDPYLLPHRNLLELSPYSRRNWSPHREEGLQRLGRDGRSPIGRRDFGRELGGGRVGRVWSRSRSPPFRQVHKRTHYDDMAPGRDFPRTSEPHQIYEFSEYAENADVGTGLRLDYVCGTSRVTREKDMLLDSDSYGHRMLGQKFVVSGAVTSRGMYGLPPDVGLITKYSESGVNCSPSSTDMDLGGFRYQRVQYPEPLLLDKLSANESYGKENSISHSRGASFSLPVSHPEELIGPSQFKDFATKSSGNAGADFSVPFKDDISLPRDEYTRSSGKFTEPLAFCKYDQMHILDARVDPEAEDKDLMFYQRDIPSPNRVKHLDYMYNRHGVREAGDYGYPSDEFQRKMALCEQVDRNDRDFLKPNIRDTVEANLDSAEGSHSLWDHPLLQKQTITDYIGMGILSAESKQSTEYLHCESDHVEYGPRVYREQGMPHLGFMEDREMLHRRSDFGSGRDAYVVSDKEINNSSKFQAETELQRLSLRAHEMKTDEHGTHGTSSGMPKRKYSTDEMMNLHGSTNFMPSKWNNSNRTLDLNDRGEEWIDQDPIDLFMLNCMGYDNDLDRKAGRPFDRADHHRVFASKNRLSFRDSTKHVQENCSKPFKPGGKYLRDHLKPGYLGKAYHLSKRHVLHTPCNVWMRHIDDKMDAHLNEVEESEEWFTSQKPNLPEDSEEFKQLVHKFFLCFTKKLNENQSVRKRYKEQGRAGSLFCIVCGRRLSREFTDTQRLVQHALMSHKVGLRAQHLGLHKAICVLMGWNSVVIPDVINQVPEAIASAEALAQKEDLILWPPVIIIHNSSVADTDTEGQQLMTVEALANFIRGKCFGGGRMKLCLGRPANHSVMVVKFLGTFSGLQDAEKLHKYFDEKKRGRTDFSKLASSKGKSSYGGIGKAWDKMEDLVLYGYMAIAEDLDKVDADTKGRCLIKSKKEIHDLANAPVKPE